MKDRIEWVDALKGLGIILVILGHSPTNPSLREYIFSFHIPLFFFISGFLFSLERNPKFKVFIWKKFKTIIVPYVMFSLISILAVFLIGEYPIQINNTILELIVSTRNKTTINNALWFLTTLFVLEVIYYLGLKLVKRHWIMLILCLAVSYLCYDYMFSSPGLPFTVDQASYFIVFYAVGNLFREYKIVERKLFVYISYICIILNVIQLLRPQSFNKWMHIIPYSHKIEMLIAVIISLIGIITFITLAQKVSESKWMTHIGKNSLIIFGLHLPIAFMTIDRILSIMKLQLQPSNILGFFYTTITLLMFIPIIFMINKYFPIVTGRRIPVELLAANQK